MTLITVRPKPGDPTKGLLRFGAVTVACALGKGGIIARKREGDGATPLAAMRLLRGRLRPRGFQQRSRLPLGFIRRDDGWCDAANDRNYNCPVALPYAGSHERMWRADHLYDAVIVLDWNLRPRRRGAGSAIFFHLARPGFAPTEGCVAIARRDMTRLLPLLSDRTVMKVTR